MKKILIITISHKAKDVRLYYKLGKTLAERYQVTIVHNRREEKWDSDADIELIALNNLSKSQFLLQSAIQINLQAPGLVILVEPILLTLINPAFHTKFVYDCHEFYTLAQKEKSLNKKSQFINTLLHQNVERVYIPKLNACITVNDIISHRYESLGTTAVTIPNYPVFKERSQENKEKIYDFIYAGGLSDYRGIKEIIRATFMVKRVVPGVRVAIIGEEQVTGFKQECVEIIKELFLEDNIDLLDAIEYEEMYEKYSQSKCGICMLSPEISRYKYALPIKLLEYLDAGLTVITNDFPATKQICQTSPGIITSKFTCEAIADSMIKVIAFDEDLITKHEEVAKKLIKEKYNWNLVAPKLLHLVDKILGNKQEALLISYFFPPLGGAGVQRPLKLVKYAEKSDWQLTVLTIKEIVFHSYDYSLLQEVENEIARADSWDIMSLMHKLKFIGKGSGTKLNKTYFQTDDFKKDLVKSLFFIDEKVGWFVPAVLQGLNLILKHNFKAIIVTIHPASSILIGLVLSKLAKLPLFIDYRDHWSLSSYLNFSCSASRRFYGNLEGYFLSQARGVITIGQVMKQELCQSFNLAESKVGVSYNGFDEDDFSKLVTSLDYQSELSKKKKKINIAYIGNMYKQRTSKYFLQAVQELITDGEINRNEIEISFMGNYYHSELEVFNNSGLGDIINIIPQQEHCKAVSAMLSNDILLLLIGSQGGKNVLTGKIFEYLRCNKPILGLVPSGGEAEKLLRKFGNNWTASLEQVDAIKSELIKILEFVKSGQVINNDISEYARETQVKKFFDFINSQIT